MATTAIQRLRRDVGFSLTDTTSLPDAEAQDLLDEAAEAYSVEGTAAIAARIYYLQGILGSSAKLATYKQNQSTENISDIFGHVKQLIEYWQTRLGEAIQGEIMDAYGSVRFGKPTRIPTREREYPDA